MYNCGIYNKELVQANLKKLENIGKLKLMLQNFDDDVLFTRKQLLEEKYIDVNDMPTDFDVAPTFKKDVIVESCGRKIVATKYYYNKSAVYKIIEIIENKCRSALKDMVSRWEYDVHDIDRRLEELVSRKKEIIEIAQLVNTYLS